MWSGFTYPSDTLNTLTGGRFLAGASAVKRVVAGLYKQLTPLLSCPVTEIKICGRLLPSIVNSHEYARLYGEDATHVGGSTEDAFIHSLTRACVLRTLRGAELANMMDYNQVRRPEHRRAMLQFDPVLLVRHPDFFNPIPHADILAETPHFQRLRVLVEDLYTLPASNSVFARHLVHHARYMALTQLLADVAYAAPVETTLPADLSTDMTP